MSPYKHLEALSRLFNTPLLISGEKMEVLSAVGINLALGRPLQSGVEARPKQPLVGCIQIFGSLVSKNGAGESGYTSYSEILASLQEAVSTGVSKVVLYIDSPGGEASSLFALTD